ncbi:MAG: hypothetical protein ACO35Q_00885, partial [Prochlorothrix sp.]
ETEALFRGDITMSLGVAIETTFHSLQDLSDRLGLRRSANPDFFGEWMTALREPGPDLERLQGVVDLLHQRHAYI